MMIGEAIKQAALDLWDELLYLMLFNMIWCIGAVLVIPLPYVTFGLYYTAYDVVEGKSIKLSTFFEYANQTWRLAYTWGLLNLAVFVVLGLNIAFYGTINAAWAVMLRFLFISLGGLWLIIQLIALTLYPRLEEPGLKIAYRNALALFGHYPVILFILIATIIFLGIMSNFLPLVLFLLTFAALSVLSSRLTKSLVQEELKRIS